MGPSRLFLECCQDVAPDVVRTPSSCKLSPRRKIICCRSLKQPGVRCWPPHRPYDNVVGALPTGALSAHGNRTITRRRTSLARKYGSRAQVLCMASRARRTRSHVGERGSLRACRPKFFRTEIFIVYRILRDPYPFPARAPRTLPRDDSCPDTGINRRYGTCPVYTGI